LAAASRTAIAASLDHFAALLVAAGAGDADAVFGAFALAEAQSELALADLNAIAAADARAGAVAQHIAEILQLSAGHFIFAATVDFAAASALFEFHLATGQDGKTGGRGGRSRAKRGLPRGRRGTPGAARHRTFRNDCTSHRPTLLSNDGYSRRVYGIARTARTTTDRALQSNPFLGSCAAAILGIARANRLQSKPNSKAALQTKLGRHYRTNICLCQKFLQ
jgi:hypothetical protein